MNLWFWDRVLPSWRAWRHELTLIGIGTILTRETLTTNSPCLVLGSGAGYGEIETADQYKHCDFRFVRGPLSAQRLNLPLDKAICDPAVLVGDFVEVQNAGSHGNVIFVPHYSTATLELPWRTWCDAVDVEYLPPIGNSIEIIQRIAGARLVIAESMHAAIIADALRVPWVVVEISDKFNTFKWRDWTASMDLPFEPVEDLRGVRDVVKRVVTAASWWSHRNVAAPASNQINEVPSYSDEREALKSSLSSMCSFVGLGVKWALWRAKRRQPSLSVDKVITTKRRLLRDALAQVAQEFETPPSRAGADLRPVLTSRASSLISGSRATAEPRLAMQKAGSR